MMGVAVAAIAIGLPFAVFVAWPLVRGRGAAVLLPLPPDPREPLIERRSAALRALLELDFEHESGHVSDEDYGELRERYEAETADVLRELDRLDTAPVEVARPKRVREVAVTGARAGWRHPAALAAAGMAVLVFGVALGVGIVRYTEPDRTAGEPMPGTRPLADMGAPGAPAMPPTGMSADGGRTIPPEVLKGMLNAARQSLFAGRSQEASAAYQAVLKRDPQNVDALTHLGLLLIMSAEGARQAELVDHGLKLFDKALGLDPNYAPALFYRGQVLYEVKRDSKGAVASWEKFVAVTPPGEDRDRALKLIADAKAGGAPKR